MSNIIITKNFPSYKRVESGNEIISIHPTIGYTVMVNDRIYIKTLANGIEQRQIWGDEYKYVLTSELKEQLAYIDELYLSPDNQAAILKLAKACGVSSTYLSQQISARVTYGVPIDGMSLSKALHTSLSSPKKTPLDERPFSEIIRSPKIEIGRCYGNNNKSTFDFINVDIVICLAYADAKLWAKKHQKQLLQFVVDAITQSDKFKKFNIPINFLKLDSAIIQRNCIIHYSFGLKGDEMGKYNKP